MKFWDIYPIYLGLSPLPGRGARPRFTQFNCTGVESFCNFSLVPSSKQQKLYLSLLTIVRTLKQQFGMSLKRKDLHIQYTLWKYVCSKCIFAILINQHGGTIQHEFDHCLEYFLNFRKITSIPFGDTISHLHDPSWIKRSISSSLGRVLKLIYKSHIFDLSWVLGDQQYIKGHVVIRNALRPWPNSHLLQWMWAPKMP